MAMTQQEFDALVAKLEKQAATNPTLYKITLGAFASLGYLYVLAVILALGAIVGVLVFSVFFSRGLLLLVKKLVIPIIVLIGVVLKAMWVKLDAPQGLAIDRREFPTLFAAIEQVRRATKAPKAHKVLLTNDLNAAIVQVPRLGMFGWQKNYLIFGLPLLQLVSSEELRAVLAHEFGHLSGAHGRFGAWIYRIRAAWARLNETLQREQHWGSFMFVPFFGWFAPKFAAYSFVQARQQEYEADRLAADTIGAQAVANALVRIDIKADELHGHYWPKVYAQADSAPMPALLPFRGLLGPDSRAFLPTAAGQLRQALQRTTDTADTHPCLKDRVAAIGVEAAIPAPVAQSAAEALLGGQLARLVEHFDSEWQTGVAAWWKARHEYVCTAKDRLAGYMNKGPDELDDDALFDYALLTEEFLDSETAFVLFKALASRSPAHTGASFAYGRLLLDKDDAAGLPILERVMSEAADAVQPGCNVIVGYLRRNGREAEIQPYVDRYWRQHDIDQAVRQERELIRPSDKLLPPDLAAEAVGALRALVASKPRIKRAYLIRKKIKDTDVRLYVLGVECKVGLFQYNSTKRRAELIQALADEARVDADIVFIALDGDDAHFKKLFKKVKGSLIYSR